MDTKVKLEKEGEVGETILVGMDLHSEAVSLCITKWRLGSDPRVFQEITTSVKAIVNTYKKQVPTTSVTIMEASTNSFAIAKKLKKAGFEAIVVSSTTLSGVARPDVINDRLDARNLARIYARNPNAVRVHIPSEQYEELREMVMGVRDASKDCTAASNRIWGFCSKHDMDLPNKRATKKVAQVAEEAATTFAPNSERAFRCKVLLSDYERAQELKKLYTQRIEAKVAETPDALKLQQVCGIGAVTALALVAFIEDVRRFEKPSKLVAYIGLNPTVCDSGTHKSKRAISNFGRKDLKSLMVEAAQSALRYGQESMHKWARQKYISKSKPYNVIICALARKMLIQVWHILMGHPAIEARSPQTFQRKMLKVARTASRNGNLKTMGYNTPQEYVQDVTNKVFTAITGSGGNSLGGTFEGLSYPSPSKIISEM